MKEEKFILNYLKRFQKILNISEEQTQCISNIFKVLKKLKSENSVHIFGNGGSASISSHFSMDLTNNSKIRCYSYNDPSLITCFSNDYKYENWISKVLLKYGKKNDILILVSSSGTSKNVKNGLKIARKLSFKKIISFTGFNKKNYLNKNSDLSFWVDSKEYNIIENTHQFFLLLLVDMVKNHKQ